jgi:hypothetical protein
MLLVLLLIHYRFELGEEDELVESFTEIKKMYEQKIDELEKEKKVQSIKFADREAQLMEEIRELQEDKAELQEKILDLEACR